MALAQTVTAQKAEAAEEQDETKTVNEQDESVTGKADAKAASKKAGSKSSQKPEENEEPTDPETIEVLTNKATGEPITIYDHYLVQKQDDINKYASAVASVKGTKYADDDNDGMIYIKKIDAGDYTALCVPQNGYDTAKYSNNVNVKKQLEYKPLPNIEQKTVPNAGDVQPAEAAPVEKVAADTVPKVESKQDKKETYEQASATAITASVGGNEITAKASDGTELFTIPNSTVVLYSNDNASTNSKTITVTPKNGAVITGVTCSNSSAVNASIKDNVITLKAGKNVSKETKVTITISAKATVEKEVKTTGSVGGAKSMAYVTKRGGLILTSELTSTPETPASSTPAPTTEPPASSAPAPTTEPPASSAPASSAVQPPESSAPTSAPSAPTPPPSSSVAPPSPAPEPSASSPNSSSSSSASSVGSSSSSSGLEKVPLLKKQKVDLTGSATFEVTVKSSQDKLLTADGKPLYTSDKQGAAQATVADYGKTLYTKTEEIKYFGWQTIENKLYYFDANGNKVTGEQTISGVKYNFGADGAVISNGTGVDVSKWQGTINWQALAPNISFAIIRCAYRGTSGNLSVDSQYARNMKQAKANGVRVGVYIYSKATTEAQAVEEASLAVQLVCEQGGVSLPIYIDIEDSATQGHLSKDQLTAIANAFCNTVRAAGYRPGVYASYSWMTKKMNTSAINGSIWCARYNTVCGLPYKYDIWQYSSKGSMPGINGRVDMNQSYF